MISRSFLNSIKGLRRNVDLLSYTTMKVSAVAPYFYVADSRSALIDVCKKAIRYHVPFLILGGGSNVVFLGNLRDKLLIKNDYREKRFLEKNGDKVILEVSSGYPVSLLAKEMVEEGIGGLEYFYGLPGTVGGAVYMNAKWMKPETYFGDLVVEAEVLDRRGKVKKVSGKYFRFAYDYSKIQESGDVVMRVVLQLKNENREKLRKRVKEVSMYRANTQPTGVFTSGCFFKNISLEEKERLGLPATSAGYLIDKAGMKGFKVGKFEVSEVHANFIINRGGGKREDLIKLVEKIKEKVKEKYNLDLKEEVVVI